MCVHGEVVVGRDICHGKYVGDLGRVVPYRFWVVAKVALLSEGDMAGIAMDAYGLCGIMDVSEQCTCADEIDC